MGTASFVGSGVYEFVVPDGITKLEVTIFPGIGADDLPPDEAELGPNLFGHVSAMQAAELDVTPGDVLTFYVPARVVNTGAEDTPSPGATSAEGNGGDGYNKAWEDSSRPGTTAGQAATYMTLGDQKVVVGGRGGTNQRDFVAEYSVWPEISSPGGTLVPLADPTPADGNNGGVGQITPFDVYLDAGGDPVAMTSGAGGGGHPGGASGSIYQRYVNETDIPDDEVTLEDLTPVDEYQATGGVSGFSYSEIDGFVGIGEVPAPWADTVDTGLGTGWQEAGALINWTEPEPSSWHIGGVHFF